MQLPSSAEHFHEPDASNLSPHAVSLKHHWDLAKNGPNLLRDSLTPYMVPCMSHSIRCIRVINHLLHRLFQEQEGAGVMRRLAGRFLTIYRETS